MKTQPSRWRQIPALVYVGVALGGTVGMWVGDLLCLGYDLWYGPFLPQASVDPQPAGWVGWWMAGGAVVGVLVGLVASILLLGLWRVATGSRRNT